MGSKARQKWTQEPHVSIPVRPKQGNALCWVGLACTARVGPSIAALVAVSFAFAALGCQSEGTVLNKAYSTYPSFQALVDAADAE